VKRKSIPLRNHWTMMHPAESAPSNRGSCHPHRCGHVHRSGRQVALEVGQPTTMREALRGIIYSPAPLPFMRDDV